MEKTINITIGGALFSVEENAYVRLKNYLESLTKHFSKYADHEEIMQDIEARIAERFASEIKPGKQALSLDQIESLIRIMGDAQEFESTESSDEGTMKEETQQPSTMRRLYRDTDHAVIAGVAAGLGAYLGIDPVIIRVLFLLTLFFGGGGLIIYLILWVAVPEAKTSAQKMALQGKPFTIEKIEQTIKENIDVAKVKEKTHSAVSGFAGAVRHLARVFEKIVRGILPLIGSIIGIGIFIASLLLIIASSLALSFILFNINLPWVEFPLREALAAPYLTVAAVAGFIVVIVPVSLLLTAGTSLASRKNKFSALGLGISLGVWMIAIMTIGAVATDIYPHIERLAENQSTTTLTRSYDVSGFTRIEASNAYHVTVTQGDFFAVEARGSERELDRIALENENGTLSLERRAPARICIGCLSDTVEFTITMPVLDSIFVSGAVEFNASDFTADNLDLDASGASRITYQGNANSIIGNLSGASHLTLQGSGTTAIIKLSGASHLDAHAFALEEAGVSLSGASRATLNATKRLSIDASGASHAAYSGTPEVIQRLSGASKIEKISEINGLITD